MKTLVAMLLALSMLLYGCTAPTNEPAVPSNKGALRQPTATGTDYNEANEMFFAPSAITTIVSATLEYKPQDNWEGETSIAHTADPQARAILADWLKDAETLAYTPGCFHSAYENRLTLTLADGTKLNALLALDGCAILCGGDVYYSFEPAPYRGTDEHPGNKILYALFGVVRE